jgi:DNA polymerase-3 subunit epsilon
MLANLTLNRPLAVFDLETTGTDPQFDRIVEISITRIETDNSSTTKTKRINPTVRIPPDATKVHGISDADVANEPTFDRYAKGIASFLEDCDLCGFNVSRFDLPLLMEEFKRANVEFSLKGRMILDPMKIYHCYDPRTLSTAVEKYLHRPHVGAHGAAADVAATIEVFNAMLMRHDDLPKSIPAILDKLKGENVVDQAGKFRKYGGKIVFTFGKYRGLDVDHVAKTHSDYLSDFILKGDFLDDTKHVAYEALVRAGKPAVKD